MRASFAEARTNVSLLAEATARIECRVTALEKSFKMASSAPDSQSGSSVVLSDRCRMQLTCGATQLTRARTEADSALRNGGVQIPAKLGLREKPSQGTLEDLPTSAGESVQTATGSREAENSVERPASQSNLLARSYSQPAPYHRQSSEGGLIVTNQMLTQSRDPSAECLLQERFLGLVQSPRSGVLRRQSSPHLGSPALLRPPSSSPGRPASQATSDTADIHAAALIASDGFSASQTRDCQASPLFPTRAGHRPVATPRLQARSSSGSPGGCQQQAFSLPSSVEVPGPQRRPLQAVPAQQDRKAYSSPNSVEVPPRGNRPAVVPAVDLTPLRRSDILLHTPVISARVGGTPVSSRRDIEPSAAVEQGSGTARRSRQELPGSARPGPDLARVKNARLPWESPGMPAKKAAAVPSPRGRPMMTERDKGYERPIVAQKGSVAKAPTVIASEFASPRMTRRTAPVHKSPRLSQ